MYELAKHEKLEMEILEGLNSIKVLNYLIFCGGTMLRLCYELNRYSVDLDFITSDSERYEFIFDSIRDYLKTGFSVKSAKNLKNTMQFEFSHKSYPRALKIEVRKLNKEFRYENRIAYSKYSNIQVMVKALTLEEMMRAKIETFLDRLQIRDAFDMEFLAKKGVFVSATKKEGAEMAAIIKKFKANDYRIKLGSLLDFKERQYYRSANFRILLAKLGEN